jgi:hypothetical protein
MASSADLPGAMRDRNSILLSNGSTNDAEPNKK